MRKGFKRRIEKKEKKKREKGRETGEWVERELSQPRSPAPPSSTFYYFSKRGRHVNSSSVCFNTMVPASCTGLSRKVQQIWGLLLDNSLSSKQQDAFRNVSVISQGRKFSRGFCEAQASLTPEEAPKPRR